MHTNSEFNQEFLKGLQHETPFFLFSKQRIISKLKEFKDAFPKADIHYAIKANSEIELLTILHEVGAHFEIASIHELEILKSVGVAAEKIVYGTSVKPAAHIKAAFAYGVDRFAFDSLSELEKIASVAPGARVYARALVNDTGSVFKFSEKFGTDKNNIVSLLERAMELGLKPYGVSFHVGSQAGNPMAWANALESLHTVFENLKKSGIEIAVINIGGGFPCSSYASVETEITLAEIAEHTLAEYKKLPYHPKLILEPGRGIIATTGILVATVIARVERNESSWLFLDAGVYNGLFEAMAYQGSTRYKITSMRQSFDAGEALFAIAGPTGDAPDIITREASLPKDIGVGDKLIIHDVGAYSLVVTSRFNGFPKPQVYLV